MDFLEAFGIEDNIDKHRKQIFYSLALIYNVIYDEMSSFFKEHNLTPGKFNILMVIKHQGKNRGISQVEIGKHLILTPSNMAKLIDKLQNEGFVVRSALEGDRRVNVTKITKKGFDLLDGIWGNYNKKLLMLTSHLTKDDQKVLSQMLMSWLNALKGK